MFKHALNTYNTIFFSSSDNGKYEIDARGLRISKLDLRDNGTYECRAEVESHGNVKLRLVTVDVLCTYVYTK